MTNFADSFHERLEDLSSSGKLSKTGTGRFNPLIAELGTHLKIAPEDVYVVSCARPNNLNIRLSQGTSQHRHKVLALGVIPEAADVQKIVAGGIKAGANFIGSDKAQYDAIGIVIKDGGKWVIGGIVEASGKDISTALLVDFPNMIVSTAAGASASTTASAATSGAAPTGHVPTALPPGDLSTLVRAFHDDLKASRLIFSDELVTRLFASLLARRFLVLTGLSGSGKTKLVEAFARWISPLPPAGEKSRRYKIVPVGADWTSSEQVLGYPDALNSSRYETRTTLELVLDATRPEHAEVPHLLILDEMNLSHVERYFSEFLSAMETEASIDLYSGPERSGVPQSIALPRNLFIAGTVNVDETTYLFSPKVLDRANVIEFRADEDEVFSFLEEFSPIDLNHLDGRGISYHALFVAAASADASLPEADRDAVAEAFRRVFRIMAIFSREFGFRTLRDVGRYVYFYRLLVGEGSWNVDEAIDAQIYQRVLPRLHGSRNQLQILVWALGSLCMGEHSSDAAFESEIIKPIKNGGSIRNPFEAPENASLVLGGFSTAKYPLSSEKLFRMNKKLREGFVSFMEA